MSDVNKLFGRSVRMAREARKMSQEDIAQILGMTRVNVSHFELGKQGVSLEQALILSKLFKISLDKLPFKMKVTVK